METVIGVPKHHMGEGTGGQEVTNGVRDAHDGQDTLVQYASMSRRLQILLPDHVQQDVRVAARRRHLSTSAWVREAIERHLLTDRPGLDPLDRLAALGAPTADIDQMLTEMAAGRRDDG
ncbi:MAG: hypothetical protein KF809_03395 [Chloroflexi bacterium]|nr:hypothetical protein [Chloroflexota bacterium]